MLEKRENISKEFSIQFFSFYVKCYFLFKEKRKRKYLSKLQKSARKSALHDKNMPLIHAEVHKKKILKRKKICTKLLI